jgi:UDP-N-acetylmuramoyl-tripeptide--D-alanyl-D-alanine ligase
LESKIQTGLFSLDEIVRAVAGDIILRPDHALSVSGVIIDSRKVFPGSLFVALAGEKTDGHRFIGDALASGSVIILVSAKERSALSEKDIRTARDRNAAFVVADDTLSALQALARFHMQKYPNVVRIGVTGSNGKTTTKELIGSILSKSAPTAVNEGNLNSEIGLPLSAFRVNDSHTYAVFEMGMNHEGEMDVLAGIVKPRYAIITNIGTAHIGNLGTQEHIALEKKKIFCCLGSEGVAFIREDEKYRSFLTEGAAFKIVSYGIKTTKGLRGYTDLGLDGFAVDWEGLRIRYPLFGFHNLINALGAISVASTLGIGQSAIRDGLESVSPLFGRSEIVRGPVTYIRDCYNANPDSVRESLRFFDTLSWDGRKIAVLGSMLELGEESERAHEEIYDFAMALNLDAIFFFGEEYGAPFGSSNGRKKNTHSVWAQDFDDLIEALKRYLREGDIVLLKGSRGMALERVCSGGLL